MVKLAFLFPGQGSQYIGMGQDLAKEFVEARDVFAEADDVLGWSLSDLVWHGTPEALSQTEITQPALLTTAVAILRTVERRGLSPSAATGLSLGEYSALVAGGALSFRDAVLLVQERGRLMQAAVPAGVGAVAAVMGLQTELVEEACRSSSTAGVVSVANYNCPGQVVIAGEVRAVELALAQCQSLGAKRAVKLPVSAPFHTALLAGAGQALRPLLEAIHFSPLHIPVASNVTAAYHTESAIVDLLVAQVSAPVRFEACVRRLLADGYNNFIEIGPGNALSSFVKRIDKEARVFSVENVQGVEQLQGWRQ